MDRRIDNSIAYASPMNYIDSVKVDGIEKKWPEYGFLFSKILSHNFSSAEISNGDLDSAVTKGRVAVRNPPSELLTHTVEDREVSFCLQLMLPSDISYLVVAYSNLFSVKKIGIDIKQVMSENDPVKRKQIAAELILDLRKNEVFMTALTEWRKAVLDQIRGLNINLQFNAKNKRRDLNTIVSKFVEDFTNLDFSTSSYTSVLNNSKIKIGRTYYYVYQVLTLADLARKSLLLVSQTGGSFVVIPGLFELYQRLKFSYSKLVLISTKEVDTRFTVIEYIA